MPFLLKKVCHTSRQLCIAVHLNIYGKFTKYLSPSKSGGYKIARVNGRPPCWTRCFRGLYPLAGLKAPCANIKKEDNHAKARSNEERPRLLFDRRTQDRLLRYGHEKERANGLLQQHRQQRQRQKQRRLLQLSFSVLSLSKKPGLSRLLFLGTPGGPDGFAVSNPFSKGGRHANRFP